MRKVSVGILSALLISFSYNASAQNYWDPRPVPKNIQLQPTEDTATFRIKAAPKMPSNASRSGFCCIEYDVTDEGLPKNVTTTFCNKKKFKSPAIESIKKAKFNPAIRNGKNITALNQSTIITYRLTNSRGELIPDRNELVLLDGVADFSEDRLCRILEIS